MYKKTVTYEDWDGNEVTEDCYFNLTRTEILEMEYNLRPGNSFSDTIMTLVEEKDMGQILSVIKDILLASYGKKSDDGRRFVKNDEIREEFAQSMVFDEIYMDLAANSDHAADFINGIMPKAVQDQLGPDSKKALMEKAAELTKGVTDNKPSSEENAE